AGIEARHYGRCPRMLRDADHCRYPNRDAEHDHKVKACTVHEDTIGLLLHDANGHAQQEEETEEKDTLELGAILTDSVIQLRQHHHKRAEANAGHTQSKQNVRRTKDFDIQAVSVVPIVVEGGGGDHRQAAPGTEEGPKRAAEPPYRNGTVTQRRILAERSGKNKICTAETREDAAELNQDVRWRPESVPTDALMPGNIPDAANDAASDR